MELELGLKITHSRDDHITSQADLRIAKDYNGFRRENIDIDINKDGNRIAISGKRVVQEMVLSGWIMHKKDVELRAFKKVFRIPDGIILDRIKAKFNDQESSLKIIMPKLVKGMTGFEIQEVTDEEEVTQSEPDKLPQGEHREPEIEEVMQNEVESTEPEILRVSEYRDSTEPEIERTGESDQIMKQADQTRKEEAEVFRDDSKGMMIQDKSEDSTTENMSAAEAESEKPQIQEREESEAVSENMIAATESKEVEQEKKIKQTAESNLIADGESPESGIVREDQIEEQISAQETTETTESVSDKQLPTESEEQAVTEVRKELQNQEPERKGEESETAKPDKERNQAQATEQLKKDEGSISEEQSREEGEIQEECPELIEKQKEADEEENKIKNNDPKGYKLRPPYVVAGSVILVSLIVLVISLLRGRRR
ncbi:uncharacterized protein LOC126678573 isoform X2 [Mercurialis annua]|uniref:uncharacterized protein LOC126678573 isoform X2 n=1 Tax=Mercurialis annua TaxID=3986 RepID=UPI00215FDD97|nr:uncharacterized protein LOC126678573 isoform X2 [Mercurialis annua]